MKYSLLGISVIDLRLARKQSGDFSMNKKFTLPIILGLLLHVQISLIPKLSCIGS
jgi:hypothetical protein